MLDCYRTGGANSPETFVTAIAATLARYPDEVIYDVTDPRFGLPVQVTWMPSIKEVFDACENAMRSVRDREEREARIADQLEQRRKENEARASRPTYADLKAKYGDNWGIAHGPERTEGPPVKAPTVDQLRHHYAHYNLGFQPKHEDAQ